MCTICATISPSGIVSTLHGYWVITLSTVRDKTLRPSFFANVTSYLYENTVSQSTFETKNVQTTQVNFRWLQSYRTLKVGDTEHQWRQFFSSVWSETSANLLHRYSTRSCSGKAVAQPKRQSPPRLLNYGSLKTARDKFFGTNLFRKCDFTHLQKLHWSVAVAF